MSTDSPLPPDSYFYSALVIGLCEGPLFVVLLVKEAPLPSSPPRYWHKLGCVQRLGRQSTGTCRVSPRAALLASAVSLERRGKTLHIWLQSASVPAAANAAAAVCFTEFLGAVPLEQQKQEEGERPPEVARMQDTSRLQPCFARQVKRIEIVRRQ